jgi:hypothetical protein
VTSPVPLTVAIAVLLDDQVIARPVNGLPFASFGVAVSCDDCPICRLTDAGLTVTVATGIAQAIVTLADAVRVPGSLVAVTVYCPQLALW